ncbi:MAG: lipid asymmetry maintenance protein MlaB [Isosphaerales bacterium]
MTVVPKEVKTILLTGPITLYEVSAVCVTLRMALADGKQLRIDLSDSGPWDLAGLQLLISCAQSARNRDLAVRLVGIPASCARVAERAGLFDWLVSVRE